MTNLVRLFCFILLIISTSVYSQNIRINEIVASNFIHFDEDGDTPDWIELYNYGSNSISLNNYTNQVSFNVLGISLAVQDLFFLSQMIFISIFLLRKIFAGKFFPHLSYFRISFLLFSFLVLKILFAFPSQGTMAFLEGKHLLYFF